MQRKNKIVGLCALAFMLACQFLPTPVPNPTATPSITPGGPTLTPSPTVTPTPFPSPVPVGSFFDLFPITVLTTSTLKQLSELEPKSRFDQRRFRMNIVVSTTETGFIENDWVGHKLMIGNELRLIVAMPDPRCVMTTLAQDELPKDIDVCGRLRGTI